MFLPEHYEIETGFRQARLLRRKQSRLELE